MGTAYLRRSALTGLEWGREFSLTISKVTGSVPFHDLSNPPRFMGIYRHQLRRGDHLRL